MAKKKFPITMFQVTPSMNIKEVVLTGKAMRSGWGGTYEMTGYAKDEKGREHYVASLFDSRAAALEAAERAVVDQEARHKKAGENIAKRRANLEKAKGAA
jgi:hypothetical protein